MVTLQLSAGPLGGNFIAHYMKSVHKWLCLVAIATTFYHAQSKPDLVIESVTLRSFPIIHQPGAPSRSGGSQTHDEFTLMIRNIGTAEYASYFYIGYCCPDQVKTNYKHYPHSMIVNMARRPIPVGDLLPVKFSTACDLIPRQVIRFAIMPTAYDPLNNFNMTLDDKDSTNNYYDYTIPKNSQ